MWEYARVEWPESGLESYPWAWFPGDAHMQKLTATEDGEPATAATLVTRMGRDGWELVSATGVASTVLWFKRPVANIA